MTGEAHARPFEVIDLTSDNESQNGDTRARRAAQNSRSVKDSQYANIPSSNHGLPEEYKWKRPSSHKNSSRTNLSDYKWHESPKIFDAMLNKSHNVSNKALHRKSSDMDSGGAAPMPNYPPILPGATIESRNFGQNNKCGHQSLPSGLFAGELPKQSSEPSSTIESPQLDQNDKRGSKFIPSDGLVGQVPKEPRGPGLTRESHQLDQNHQNGYKILPSNYLSFADRKPKKVRAFKGQQRSVVNSSTMHNDTEEETRITYSPLNPTEPSSLKRHRLNTKESLQRSSNIPTHNYNNRGFQEHEPPPILPMKKTVISGASRAGGSDSPSSSSSATDKRSTSSKTEKMLREDLVPQFKKAAARYEGSLPQDQLSKIASQVAVDMVNGRKFRQDLSENGGTLSDKYKQNLPQIVQDLLDDAMREKVSSVMIPDANQDVTMSDAQPAYDTPTTSAETPESDNMFEDAHQFPTQSRILPNSRFQPDSSPPTSFSLSRANSHNQSTEPDEGTPSQTASHSGRVTRGASKPNYYGQKKAPNALNHEPANTQKSTRRNRESSKSQQEKQITKPSQRTREPFRSQQEEEVTEPRSKERGKKITMSAPVPLDKDSGGTPSFGLSVRTKLESMLRQRELHGMVPVRPRIGQISYKTMATNAIEDSLVRDYQWVHQSGDATTITWTGETTFVSGALAHYDVHNMQYNRHGNLVVGSTANKVVKMIDGHRALRPIVTAAENKENSLPAMRATQDEWRYAPVVSSAYCDVNGYTFTASFDKTVKIWRVLEKGPSMQLKGIWLHDFGVNFVLTSKHHDMVATASEAHNDAVRVYKFDETDVSRSAYDVYNADRALTRPGDLRMADKWAYHPATMQWGRSDKVSNLLLVGYSPRGTSNDEAEIPESKRNSGELCCWNAKTGQQVLINAGKSANVFEVIWHPSQPIFLVATAPSGTFDSRKTRTQVRLFQLVGSDIESFQCVKTLDCPASDVNELTMMPTSLHDGYVTASCTDGKTYVWDTMHDDRLLHVLPHGDSIDNPDHEIPLEQADTGVKFAAWGRSSNRLYTGSSDGVVKAWDITRPTADALVRDVLRAASGISCGIFSADFSKLLIGDGAGHLHLIQAADDESDDRDPLFLPLTRRKFMVPHPDPFSDREILENREEYRRYMEQGILIKLPMDVPGWGAHYRVGKGPNYDLCGLYRSDAHEDGDNTKPLLPKIGNTTNWDGVTKVRPQVGNFPVLLPAESSRKRQHNRLEDLDLDVNKLLASTKSKDLKQDLAISAEYMLNFEEEGRDYVLDK